LEADSNGTVLATDVEGERIDAGKLSEALTGVAVVFGAELTPRSVVIVVCWTTGVEVAAAG
jgi:hypothetical protein